MFVGINERQVVGVGLAIFRALWWRFGRAAVMVPPSVACFLAHRPTGGAWMFAPNISTTCITTRRRGGPDDGRTVVLRGFPSAGTRGDTSSPPWGGGLPRSSTSAAAGRPTCPATGSVHQLHLVGDLVGLLDAPGVERAAVVGHDWGAPAAWHAALRPTALTLLLRQRALGGIAPRPTPEEATW